MPGNLLERDDRPLAEKLGHVLGRLAVAMRAGDWAAWGAEGLNPTQGQILLLLHRRGVGLRLSEIAAELAVSPPSISDSVTSLEEKGLVRKQRASDDRRALAVRLSARGRRLVTGLDQTSGNLGTALGSLSRGEQTGLYRSLLKLLRQLQQSESIPAARMCVTCEHFRPNVHRDARRPHHCALVDAAFGDGTLRWDCPDHQPADPAAAEQTWRTFVMSE